MDRKLLIIVFVMVVAMPQLAFSRGPCWHPARAEAAMTDSDRDCGGVILALKSNLLADLLITPNVELELAIGNKWSLNADYIFPWWLNKTNNNFAYQLVAASLEGRYWFGDRTARRPLTGHFAGVFIGTGLYDLQFKKDEGYRGRLGLWSGITYGYAMPVINDNFSLEFSLSIGYFRTKYDKYDVVENGSRLAYCYTGKYTWFGPTKAKVTFVWLMPFFKNRNW